MTDNNTTIIKKAITTMKSIPTSVRFIPETPDEIALRKLGTLTDYDPTQKNEPDLALISSLSNFITAIPISGTWENPFGLKNALVNSITIALSASKTPILTAGFGLDFGAVEVSDGSLVFDLANQSVELDGTLTNYDPTQKNEPDLAIISSLSLTDTNTITATPSDTWKNPFGLNGVSLSNINLSLSSDSSFLAADFDLDFGNFKLKDGNIFLDLTNESLALSADVKAFDLPTFQDTTLTLDSDEITFDSEIDIGSWAVAGEVTLNTESKSFSQTGNIVFGTGDPVSKFFTNTLGISSLNESLTVSKNLTQLEASVSGNLTLVNSGGFKATMTGATFQTSTLQQLPLPPKVTTGLFGNISLTGYDPTQFNEPKLDLTAGALFSPDSFGISGSLDTRGKWQNPFGFKGMTISTITIDAGAFLTTPPTPEHFGFVADAKLNGMDLTGLFYASLNPLSPSLAFALTVNKEVGLSEMMLACQAGLASAVPGATSVINSFTNLLDPFDPQVISIDGDNDGSLDPLVQFMPTAVIIADKSYDPGYAINAKVSIGGASGTLSFKANTDFSDISGNLNIHNLHLSDWLVISGADDEKDLTVSFGMSITDKTIYFDASAKLALFGYDIAQADINVTPTSIHVEDTFINFIPTVLSLNIDYFDVDIPKLSASGKAEINLFGQNIVGTEFDFSPSSLGFASYIDLAGIFGIDAEFSLDTKTGSLHAEGDMSFFKNELASATLDYTQNDGLVLTGGLRVKVNNIGTVDATLKVETHDVGDFKINVEADVPRIGNLNFSVNSDDVDADFIGKYIENQFLNLGDKVEWVADEIRGATDALGNVSSTLLNNVGHDITAGLEDAGGSIIAGTRDVTKSVKKLFGGGGSNHSNKKYATDSVLYLGDENSNGKYDHGNPIKGSTKADVMFGNGGNDVIAGGTGEDSLDGGNGNDSMEGGIDNDMLNGGDGNDLLEGSEGADTIYGGSGNDYISNAFGNDVGDWIDGGAGNDTIYGDDGGHDTIYGGTGNDLIQSYGGNDYINGGSGNDTIEGGDGTDTIDYSFYNQAAITVTMPDDYLKTTTVISSSGTDYLTLVEYIIGSAYADKITGNKYANVFKGGDGNDSIWGGVGNDNIDGGNDNDSLSGGTGNDKLNGSDGNDVLEGSEGADTIYGGNGNDTISNAYGDNVGDWIDGGTGNDSIQGDDGGNDTIYGGDGNDTINCYGGNDTLNGGNGNDSLDGGSGNDTIDYGNETVAVTIVLSDTSATSYLTTVTVASDNIDTFKNIEYINGSGFGDSLMGNSLANILNGGVGNDTLNGAAGNDSLDGGDAIDSLDGGDGNDYLYGGTGKYSDTLNGGAGNDTLFGGDGNDIFKFELDSDLTTVGYDVITDFKSGQDKIDLSSIDANTAISGDQAFTLITGSVFTAAGQLRFDSEKKMLYGSIDSDVYAEFSVLLTGVTSVTASNFNL